ncbi:MAG: hypothetical protein IJY42_05060 [Clostridia bacterium]|nr:hypothetical protein [Clostridia bacterium]
MAGNRGTTVGVDEKLPCVRSASSVSLPTPLRSAASLLRKHCDYYFFAEDGEFQVITRSVVVGDAASGG